MNAPGTLQIDDEGKIELPDAVRHRYGLQSNASVRVIETRTGILLIPMTNEPMSEALRQELEQWQEVSAASLVDLPYEDDAR